MAASVVYIEDRTSDAALVERVLSFLPDVRYVAAAEGKAGIVAARTLRPDVLLLDLQLPDMPGLEVLGTIRGEAATKDIPVVVISADAGPEFETAAYSAGANAFLTKPIQVDQLLNVVEGLLAIGRARAPRA